MVDRSLPPEFPDAPEVQQVGQPTGAPGLPRGSSAAKAAGPWLIATLVVLLLAASAGLGAAWIVAAMRAVPVPAAAQITPTPVPASSGSGTPSSRPSLTPSGQPRHTPTPAPLTTPEPPPFIHVVQRNETLLYIAELYGVSIEDIVALNDIRNPDLIHRDQELLIPGYGTRPSPTPR